MKFQIAYITLLTSKILPRMFAKEATRDFEPFPSFPDDFLEERHTEPTMGILEPKRMSKLPNTDFMDCGFVPET